MKKLILLLIGCTALLSCHKKEGNSNPTSEACDLKTDIESPTGYKIRIKGKINFSGSINNFQFVNDDIGYALASKGAGSYVEVLKTIDGGETWHSLNVEINQYPVSMVFRDKDYGLVSVHDVNGCPADCQNRCIIYKTENGGASWEKLAFSNLQGILYHLKFDTDGNLYATLFLDGHSTLVKSMDNGNSWDILYSSADLGFTLVTFSYELFQDQIFVSGNKGKLVVIDKNGNFLRTIETNESTIWDLKVISDQNLVVVASGKVIKSTDGGATWQVIYAESARMIDFTSADRGLMLLNKGYCDSDVYQANDLIASTQNGGTDWNEAGETTTDMVINYANAQKMDTGLYFLMIDQKLLELKEN